ncbi:MAG: hypothetical protein ACRD9S_24150 [Pyrinomonadaceae bacterium]
MNHTLTKGESALLFFGNANAKVPAVNVGVFRMNMKYGQRLIVALNGILWTVAAQAAPLESVNLTTQNKAANARYGLFNYKTVMPGVLYRGSSSGAKGQKAPLTAASAQALCQDGFDAVVYAYGTGWSGGDKSIKCANGQLTYTVKRWDHSDEVKAVLKEIHNIIQDGHGAMYLHCHYGVHASGFEVTAALMQFCGLSGEEGVKYWNSNVAKTIQYPKVQQMIRAFKPYSELKISAEQQARVCPKGL